MVLKTAFPLSWRNLLPCPFSPSQTGFPAAPLLDLSIPGPASLPVDSGDWRHLALVSYSGVISSALSSRAPAGGLSSQEMHTEAMPAQWLHSDFLRQAEKGQGATLGLEREGKARSPAVTLGIAEVQVRRQVSMIRHTCKTAQVSPGCIHRNWRLPALSLRTVRCKYLYPLVPFLKTDLSL